MSATHYARTEHRLYVMQCRLERLIADAAAVDYDAARWADVLLHLTRAQDALRQARAIHRAVSNQDS